MAILGVGLWIQFEKGDYVAIADSDKGLTGVVLIIVIGVGTTVFSFIGILGAVKRIRWLLWVVSVCSTI